MIQRKRTPTAAPLRHGVSLIELMVVLAILGILIAAAVPSFRRSLEQSRADIAVANLRSIWTAQRLYWLAYREGFADELSDLESAELIDSALVTASTPYTYEITAADATTFTATATREGGGAWSGFFTIDQTGVVAGSISASGEADIVPGFQD